MADHGFVWTGGAKDWLLIIGFLVILFVSLAYGLPEEADRSSDRRKKVSEAHGFYLVAILDWMCIVYFLEFRRGLVLHLGLPEAWSWVLAPIGLVLLLAASIALWVATYGEESDEVSRLRWLATCALCLGAFLVYVTIAAGPSAWFRSS